MTSPTDATPADPMIEVADLRVEFSVSSGFGSRRARAVKAVDGVSLSIARGETLGLVGESGCGKSTFGKVLVRLLDATAGTVILHDETTGAPMDLARARGKDLEQIRRRAQIIFQDPYSSLNPAIPIVDSLRRGLNKHKIGTRKEQRALLAELFRKVNLRPEYLDRYPHEFSGGQRQRIAIVRALSINPEFVVCDEAVSALDVSVQAQVLDLLKEFKAERRLTYLFISHDLSVVEYMADRVAVMYLGQIVELTDSTQLFADPQHPYTKALLSAIPTIDAATRRQRIVLAGEIASPANPPAGCRFHPRCPIAVDKCAQLPPPLRNIGTPDAPHLVSCHLVD